MKNSGFFWRDLRYEASWPSNNQSFSQMDKIIKSSRHLVFARVWIDPIDSIFNMLGDSVLKDGVAN